MTSITPAAQWKTRNNHCEVTKQQLYLTWIQFSLNPYD